jgi:hypothetical protein
MSPATRRHGLWVARTAGQVPPRQIAENAVQLSYTRRHARPGPSDLENDAGICPQPCPLRRTSIFACRVATPEELRKADVTACRQGIASGKDSDTSARAQRRSSSLIQSASAAGFTFTVLRPPPLRGKSRRAIRRSGLGHLHGVAALRAAARFEHLLGAPHVRRLLSPHREEKRCAVDTHIVGAIVDSTPTRHRAEVQRKPRRPDRAERRGPHIAY